MSNTTNRFITTPTPSQLFSSVWGLFSTMFNAVSSFIGNVLSKLSSQNTDAVAPVEGADEDADAHQVLEHAAAVRIERQPALPVQNADFEGETIGARLRNRRGH